MALSRCEKHGNPIGRNGNEYTNFVEPINYPNSSTICGRNGCDNSGLIWLNKKEYEEYQNGREIFKFANNTTKVKVRL